MSYVILIVKDTGRGKWAVPVVEDTPSQDVTVFDSMEDARKCANIQPMVQAYGGWILDLETGETFDAR